MVLSCQFTWPYGCTWAACNKTNITGYRKGNFFSPVDIPISAKRTDKSSKSNEDDKDEAHNSPGKNKDKSNNGDKDDPQNSRDENKDKSNDGDEDEPQNSRDEKKDKSNNGDEYEPQNSRDQNKDKSNDDSKQEPEGSESLGEMSSRYQPKASDVDCICHEKKKRIDNFLLFPPARSSFLVSFPFYHPLFTSLFFDVRFLVDIKELFDVLFWEFISYCTKM